MDQQNIAVRKKAQLITIGDLSQKAWLKLFCRLFSGYRIQDMQFTVFDISDQIDGASKQLIRIQTECREKLNIGVAF